MSTKHITTQKTVWCTVCSHWQQFDVNTKAQAIKRARTHGWKYTKDGWHCKACVEIEKP